MYDVFFLEEKQLLMRKYFKQGVRGLVVFVMQEALALFIADLPF